MNANKNGTLTANLALRIITKRLCYYFRILYLGLTNGNLQENQDCQTKHSKLFHKTLHLFLFLRSTYLIFQVGLEYILTKALHSSMIRLCS